MHCTRQKSAALRNKIVATRRMYTEQDAKQTKRNETAKKHKEEKHASKTYKKYTCTSTHGE